MAANGSSDVPITFSQFLAAEFLAQENSEAQGLQIGFEGQIFDKEIFLQALRHFNCLWEKHFVQPLQDELVAKGNPPKNRLVEMPVRNRCKFREKNRRKFLRRSSQKSSSGDPPLVIRQPMGFSVDCLDGMSQHLYHKLKTKHKTGEQLTEMVNEAGTKLLIDVKHKLPAKGLLPYDEFLKIVMYKDERLLSSDHLAFESLTIYDDNFNVKYTKRAGRAILTNKRILLISSKYHEDFTLREVGNALFPSGGYKASLEYFSSTYYLPLPLHLFRGIEVAGKEGGIGSIDISSDYSFWKDCLCKCCCCGLCGPTLTWITHSLDFAYINETHITFGILMPPWGKMSFLRLYLGKDIQIQHIYNMLALYREAMPNVR